MAQLSTAAERDIVGRGCFTRVSSRIALSNTAFFRPVIILPVHLIVLFETLCYFGRGRLGELPASDYLLRYRIFPHEANVT